MPRVTPGSPGDPSERYTTARFLTHKGVIENVEMNVWHLKLVLARLGQSKCPRLEWCFIPLAMFLGIGLVLLTTEFKDAFGIDKTVWNAWAILVLQITGLASAGLFVWWLIDRVSHATGLWPLKTSDEIVDEIISQMEREREAFAERHGASYTQMPVSSKRDAP